MDIRPAVSGDEKGVLDLWELLLQFYGKKAERRVLRRSFRYAVNHPCLVRIFVAAGESKIAGTASLHMGHYSTWNDHWYGHLEDVIVAPAFRRQGVGSRLIREIIETAKREGLARLELNALAENSAARRLYELLGFQSDSVVYELPLN